MSKWVAGTCVGIDIPVGDTEFVRSSVMASDAWRGFGLIIVPISYVGLANRLTGKCANFLTR